MPPAVKSNPSAHTTHYRKLEFHSTKAACCAAISPTCALFKSRNFNLAVRRRRAPKSKSKRRSAGSAAFKFSPRGFTPFAGERRPPSRAFKFTSLKADLRSVHNERAIARPLLRTIKFSRAARRAMRANLKTRRIYNRSNFKPGPSD